MINEKTNYKDKHPIIEKEVVDRRINNLECSEYNRQEMIKKMYRTQKTLDYKKTKRPALTNLNEDEEEMTSLNACSRVIFNNKRSIDVSPDDQYTQFETHNKREFSPKYIDLAKFKRFYKRKNQF